MSDSEGERGSKWSGRGGRGGRGRFNNDDNGESGRDGGFRGRGRGFNRDGDERSYDRTDGDERGRGRGGRGRGRGHFDRRDSNDERKDGKWGSSFDGDRDRNDDREERRGRGRGGRGSRGGDRDRWGGDNRRGSDDEGRNGRGWGKDDDTKGGEEFGEDGEPSKPAPVNYIPTERSEEDLFSETGIRKGVNFSDFDDIKVKVSGENIPEPINSFEEAQLRSLIISNLKKCNYDKPTPIQKYAIPIIMAGRDLMATAQTGSGKTAAFLLPIVQTLLSNSESPSSAGSCVSPRVIILSPTRELAIQIEENARRITSQSSLKTTLLYGGVQSRHQSARLSHGCDIVIATVGRLMDFLNRGFMKFDAVEFVVMDEADRMLDMGFHAEIGKIMKHESMTPQNSRQTLMFSATFSAEVQGIAAEYLRKDYVFVTVGIVGGACKDVEQNFLHCGRNEKRSKLFELLDEQDSVDGTLMFVEQKRIVDFVANFLCEKGYATTSIHGDREQKQREQALGDFKSKRMHILVATNVAARGLDISGVKHVINYDMPKDIDEYVHRIGRTGRLGNKGKSTSFYDSENDRALANKLVNILKQAGQPVPDFIQNDSTHVSDDAPQEFGGSDFRNDAGAAKSNDWDD